MKEKEDKKILKANEYIHIRNIHIHIYTKLKIKICDQLKNSKHNDIANGNKCSNDKQNENKQK